MTHPLIAIQKKKSLTAVGLMSGTSMDGVDAALVTLGTAAEAPAPALGEFVALPYPEELRESLEDAAAGSQLTAEDVARLQTGVAVAFAGANAAQVTLFNGDLLPDLVVTNWQEDTLGILLGTDSPPGTFVKLNNFFSGDGPSRPAIGDFNNDGVPDAAVASRGEDSVSIMLGYCKD